MNCSGVCKLEQALLDLLDLIQLDGHGHAELGEQNAHNVTEKDAIDAQGYDHWTDYDPVVLGIGIAVPARTVQRVRHQGGPGQHHQQRQS